MRATLDLVAEKQVATLPTAYDSVIFDLSGPFLLTSASCLIAAPAARHRDCSLPGCRELIRLPAANKNRKRSLTPIRPFAMDTTRTTVIFDPIRSE